ncbi:protein-L-isoaspartate O-methyltransferase [Altererythrobacter indicus]|uniref:Protein-L-isoaspartate O-methyltransferase n=2 Tax=Altericroceibacterium indicum TaxID=374177 RepID=A0A845A8A2_9SPHN|nr:protein-L-isoaspartate O-methyltransferase [Altericroceibacterium indicum]MXP26450.1 protein-L-isoaspartate O-methyltransferase [Altericroceibacterium indicum]
MIDSQLRTSGVNTEWVLKRMSAVAREDFVPESAKSVAYMDRAVPLGDGKYLAAPVVQGTMLQEANPQMSDKALLVDGGSGYLAELLRPLVASLDVVSAENAVAGTVPSRGYDLVLIDGAVEHLPEALVTQLADDARVITGYMLNGVTRIATGRKAADEVALLPIAEIGVPVLPEFNKAKAWSF